MEHTCIYLKAQTINYRDSFFSGQNEGILVKFMSIVLPGGYILDTIGPFYGNN